MARRWLLLAVLLMIVTALLAQLIGPWVWTVFTFGTLISYPVLFLVRAGRRRP